MWPRRTSTSSSTTIRSSEKREQIAAASLFCLGGSPARAGFANGSGTFQELASSGVVGGFLDSNLTTGLVNTSLNNSQLGRHIIPMRGGTPILEVEADLSVTKTASPNPVLLGSDLTYTVVMSNGGPSTGSQVTLTDTLPVGVSFVSSSASPGTCSGTSTVTCTLSSLASGDSATVTIVVIPTATGDLTNTAVASADEGDPSTGDNTATAISTAPASPPSVDIVEVPSMTQWGLVGMAVTFAVLILLGLGFRSRFRPKTGRPL